MRPTTLVPVNFSRATRPQTRGAASFSKEKAAPKMEGGSAKQ
jgi:hypothetical protein